MRRTLPYVGGSVCVQPVRISPAEVAMPLMKVRRGIELRWFMLLPPRHGPQLLSKAGGDDHRDVNEEEQQQRREPEKMHGPGCLVAAENIQEHGVPGRDRG